MGSPANARKAWTAAEEAELLRAFETGANVDQLAQQHARTPQAIYGRLYRLGKVPAWRPGMGLVWDRRTTTGGPSSPAPAAPATVRLDGLNAAARALVRAKFSSDELPLILRAEIASLEGDSGRHITVRDGRGGIWFGFATRRHCGDASIRKPNEVRFLSATIDGVLVVVNLHKPGAYRHGNVEVAAALRALASAVETTSVALADHDFSLPVDA